MKQKIFKRSAILFLVVLMIFLNTSNVLAAEVKQEISSKNEMEILAEYAITVGEENSTWANTPVRDSVSPNSYVDMHPYLNSYFGINKTIIVNATSDSTSGALLLYLYNPSGDLVSHDWIMGVNEIAQWNLVLPSSGEWRLRVIAQGTTSMVNVYARWE